MNNVYAQRIHPKSFTHKKPNRVGREPIYVYLMPLYTWSVCVCATFYGSTF